MRKEILIAEDEAFIATRLEERISLMGYGVLGTASSGEESIEMARRLNPDLVLMDIVMPGKLDGIDASEIIRSELGIPIIFMTAYGDDDFIARARNVEPFGYILKPFQKDELKAAIEIAFHKKEMEERLKESEARFREMADLQPNVMYETDMDLRTTYVNRAGLELLGYTREELDKGINAMDHVHPGDREKAARHIERLTEGGSPGPTEYRMLKKDGTQITVLLNGAPIYREGKITGFRGSMADITELKKTQKELLRAKKFSSLWILSGGIAHDYNNLLTAIMGNIELAQTHMRPGDQAYTLLERARKASGEARGLTRKFLSLSRASKPLMRPTAISPILRHETETALEGSNIKVEFSLPDDLWRVEIDEDQMVDVIHHLVTNAREAMSTCTDEKASRPGGGTVRVRAENVNLTEDSHLLKAGRFLRVSIEDEGGGIPEEDLERVFDPYFSTKERGAERGMGLGLTICDSIIERHGGFITAEPESGKGTTFHIYLPATANAQVRQAGLPASTEERPGETVSEFQGAGLGHKENLEHEVKESSIKRILVMDDEELVRDVNAALLSHAGYEVGLAVDGAEAIELYKKAMESGEPFDAVILDLTNQFGMGGVETIGKLLEIDTDIKAIVATGYSADPILTRYARYGFRGAIAKPFSTDELYKTVEEVLK